MTTSTLDLAAGGRILAEETLTGTVRYLYGPECLGELRDGQWLYYLSDAEGLVRQGVDAEGEVVSSWLFDPDGVVLEGPEGPVSHLVCSGVYDWSTGLIYRDGRYFDPMLGTWLALAPLVVVQSWRGRRKRRGWTSWVALALFVVGITGTLTACRGRPTHEDLKQICVEVTEPRGKCHITSYTVLKEEIIKDPEDGFYKDFVAAFCGNPADLQQCFFVQWVRGTMEGKDTMGNPISGTSVNLPDWEVDVPGRLGEKLMPDDDAQIPSYNFEWPQGTSRSVLKLVGSAWVFNDIPGFNIGAVPLVSGGTYSANLEFRLNVYDRADFPYGTARRYFRSPDDPPPVASLHWSFYGTYRPPEQW